MLLRLLNSQGIAGIAAAACLAVLLPLQKAETRHWKKQSAGFEQLYRGEQATLAGTVANYRAAADRPAPPTRPTLARVAAQQRAISERTSDDFETRLAAARARCSAPARPRTPAPQPIPALAEQRLCPAYPLPPEALLKPPVKTNFLDPTR